MTEPEWDGKTERRIQLLQFQQDVLNRLDHLNKDMDKIILFIEGNGDPQKGAIVRMDRIEQQLRVVWGIAVATGGLVIKAILDWFIQR